MKSISIEKLKTIIEQQQDRLFWQTLDNPAPDPERLHKILADVLLLAIKESDSNALEIHLQHEINCQSKGEKKVADALLELGYTPYHNIIKNDCRGNSRSLPFDFGIIVNGRELLIEYDGEHHDKSVQFFGGDDKLDLVKKYDEIKNNYCRENNIPLLRIRPGMSIRHTLRKFIKENGGT